MLFNTFAFFLIFLTAALFGYFRLSKYSIRLAIWFLLFCSLIFYSYWSIRFLPLLLFSVAVNFFLGGVIIRRRAISSDASRGYLQVGLLFNLSLLIFFKYADFLLGNIAAVTGWPIHSLGITLPIGISFFTFTQIAYLIDCHASKVRHSQLASYGLFVTYFPHLIAGPILHHKEMMPQFEDTSTHVFHRGRLAMGIVFFTIGLFKKVVLADGVSVFVAPVFDVSYQHLGVLEAWCGALAYTFQLYFDFSAYSDMAYGISYMFGVVLPINFNSPYQATSIIEFWRRWHITLSTFLRDYLYIPLGGNRNGPARRYLNLLLTMMLGGLWHGANWTFVIWGMLHGAYLIINHALRHLIGEREHIVVRALGAILTFFAVVLAWVFFRASSIDTALAILHAMFGGTLPATMEPASLFQDRIFDLHACAVWLTLCAAIAFLLPNAYRVFGTGLQPRFEATMARERGGLVLGGLLSMCLVLLAISETRGVSEFLYFNF
jgi:D-alanyl-lipoteichoic acid acyltransferase DltB (MBOAT superfamily)